MKLTVYEIYEIKKNLLAEIYTIDFYYQIKLLIIIEKKNIRVDLLFY